MVRNEHFACNKHMISDMNVIHRCDMYIVIYLHMIAYLDPYAVT
jgi:hypothetical protein